MNPDQTALSFEQSDLDPYYLQYMLPKNINRREEQTKNVLTGGKRVKQAHSELAQPHNLLRAFGVHTSIVYK